MGTKKLEMYQYHCDFCHKQHLFTDMDIDASYYTNLDVKYGEEKKLDKNKITLYTTCGIFQHKLTKKEIPDDVRQKVIDRFVASEKRLMQEVMKYATIQPSGVVKIDKPTPFYLLCEDILNHKLVGEFTTRRGEKLKSELLERDHGSGNHYYKMQYCYDTSADTSYHYTLDGYLWRDQKAKNDIVHFNGQYEGGIEVDCDIKDTGYAKIYTVEDKNLNWIAKQCLDGNLSGIFVLRGGIRICSSMLISEDCLNIPFSKGGEEGRPLFGTNGCWFGSYRTTYYDVIDFIPDDGYQLPKLICNLSKGDIVIVKDVLTKSEKCDVVIDGVHYTERSTYEDIPAMVENVVTSSNDRYISIWFNGEEHKFWKSDVFKPEIEEFKVLTTLSR